MFDFTITSTCPNTLARTGIFKTPHGDIETPVFMPVGTKGTVKTLSQEDLKKLGVEIILSNTYHLYLRPGAETVKEMGKLHDWIKWQKPILTDSGGYQVFSLALEKGFNKNKAFKTRVKIDGNGVEFKSHIDGSKHYFTPEKVMGIQHDLGADIIMAFDECAPSESSPQYFKEAMQRTHDWLIRCKNEHEKLLAQNGESRALFGISQGGMDVRLRAQSAKFVNDLDLPGNAIGGLSVGESKKIMQEMIEATLPHLSPNKPRYLMGVGTPEDLLECVDRGIDMFDCVHPTRMARHGTFWTNNGRFSIKNEKYKNDHALLYGDYSKSYVRHLLMENEILGLHILTMHNLNFLLDLMRKIRKHIQEGSFPGFKTNFLRQFHSRETS